MAQTNKSYPAHQKACCVLHGCQVSIPASDKKDSRCPVFKELCFQDKPCEKCEASGIGEGLNPGNAIVEALAVKKGWIHVCQNCGLPDRKPARYWLVIHRQSDSSMINLYKLDSRNRPTVEQVNAYICPGPKIHEWDTFTIEEISDTIYFALSEAAWIRP